MVLGMKMSPRHCIEPGQQLIVIDIVLGSYFIRTELNSWCFCAMSQKIEETNRLNSPLLRSVELFFPHLSYRSSTVFLQFLVSSKVKGPSRRFCPRLCRSGATGWDVWSVKGLRIRVARSCWRRP